MNLQNFLNFTTKIDSKSTSEQQIVIPVIIIFVKLYKTKQEVKFDDNFVVFSVHLLLFQADQVSA